MYVQSIQSMSAHPLLVAIGQLYTHPGGASATTTLPYTVLLRHHFVDAQVKSLGTTP